MVFATAVWLYGSSGLAGVGETLQPLPGVLSAAIQVQGALLESLKMLKELLRLRRSLNAIPFWAAT